MYIFTLFHNIQINLNLSIEKQKSAWNSKLLLTQSVKNIAWNVSISNVFHYFKLNL